MVENRDVCRARTSVGRSNQTVLIGFGYASGHPRHIIEGKLRDATSIAERHLVKRDALDVGMVHGRAHKCGIARIGFETFDLDGRLHRLQEPRIKAVIGTDVPEGLKLSIPHDPAERRADVWFVAMPHCGMLNTAASDWKRNAIGPQPYFAVQLSQESSTERILPEPVNWMQSAEQGRSHGILLLPVFDEVKRASVASSAK